MLRFEHTKNGERRGVPVAQIALDVLQAWHTLRGASPWVFPGPMAVPRSTWIAPGRGPSAGPASLIFMCMICGTRPRRTWRCRGRVCWRLPNLLGHKTMQMVPTIRTYDL